MLLPVHHQAPPRVSCGSEQVSPQEGGPEVQPVQPLLLFSHFAKSQQELARRGVTVSSKWVNCLQLSVEAHSCWQEVAV